MFRKALILGIIVLLFSFNKGIEKNVSLSNPLNDSSFCRLMDKYSVFNDRFIVNDLYTWTTKEQVEEIRKNKNVLIKSSSEKYGKANYDIVLEEKKKQGNEIATLLLNSLYAKKRFAWPHPWATVRGYPGENYGDQLLKISFKSDAIVGRFITSNADAPFHFYDMKGKSLSIDYVKQNFDRLAYVYFVNERKTSKKMLYYRGTMRRRSTRIINSEGPFPYREYVICNQEMIREVSVGTDAIKQKLKYDIDFLEFLKINFWLDEDKGGCGPVDKFDAYLETTVMDDWSSNWLTAYCCDYGKIIALVNEYYDLNKKQLNKTVDVLNAALMNQSTPFVITY
jgi:hypothetical protein